MHREDGAGDATAASVCLPLQATNQHSGFKVPDSSLAGDLGPPQAVYFDLSDALLVTGVDR
jgi:hypothetical protein